MAAQENLAAVLPFQKPKGMDFGAALAATKTTAAAPKKGKMQTMEVTPEVAAAVDEYQEAATDKKRAEAIMDRAGPVIIDHVRAGQDQDGFAGKFHGSYAILGTQSSAKVVFANKYTLAAEDEAELQSILGQNYGAMIVKKPLVTLRAEVFESAELQAALMEMVGERFPEFFETKISLGVCEEFNKIVYQVLQPEDLESLRVYAKQYKPSIR